MIFFLRKEVNKEIGYDCKRGQDQINLLSMTPIGVYNPFLIIDFLAMFRENFLSLIDGLITPKREGRVMGDLDVETFPLTESEVLERGED